MWGFVWEPIVSAAITGVLALVGIVMTVRSQSNKTREAGLSQHKDQDKKLDELLKAHKTLDKKIDANKEIAEVGISELKGQVGGLESTYNVLFGMIVDLDKKVTKAPNNRKRPSLEDIHQ